jgi:hypothetical protein
MMTKPSLLLSLFVLVLTAAMAPSFCAAQESGRLSVGGGASGYGETSGQITAKGADQTKEGIAELVEKLGQTVDKAKKKLQGAVRSPDERMAQFDEMIATVTKALAEVSDGGEVNTLLQTAITKSEAKMKEYKAKMSDPNSSAKTQETYQRLADKFRSSSEGLIRSRMAMNTKRGDLEASLKSAVEQKTLFIDLVQADELIEANNAVMDLISIMGQVSDSISDMASELSKSDSKAPVAPPQ